MIYTCTPTRATERALTEKRKECRVCTSSISCIKGSAIRARLRMCRHGAKILDEASQRERIAIPTA